MTFIGKLIGRVRDAILLRRAMKEAWKAYGDKAVLENPGEPNAPKVGTWFYGRRLYKWSEAMGTNTHGLMAMAMTAEEFQNRWLYYPHLIINN